MSSSSDPENLLQRITIQDTKQIKQIKSAEVLLEINRFDLETKAQFISHLLVWFLDNPNHHYFKNQLPQIILIELLNQSDNWSMDDVPLLLQVGIQRQNPHLFQLGNNLRLILKHFFSKEPPPEEIEPLIKELIEVWSPWANTSKIRKWVTQLRACLGEEAHYSIPINSGEAWADEAIQHVLSLDKATQEQWISLLDHCGKANGSKPKKRWLADAMTFRDGVGDELFKTAVSQWFLLVDKPRTKARQRVYAYQPDPNLTLDEYNIDILKGLVWLCSDFTEPEIARAVTAVVLSSYRKIPQVGPRAVRLGNAAVWCLGQMPTQEAVGQLALLKVKVKLRNAQKGIDKALTEAANRHGMSREEIEEISVPVYGLTAVGKAAIPFEGYRADVTVDGRTATIQWFKPDGNPQKSIPKFVKDNFSGELKTLKQQAKDVQAMLPAQKARLEAHYLRQSHWSFPVWQERYHDHYLIGTIARRLIWHFSEGEQAAAGIWNGTHFVDFNNHKIEWLTEKTTVKLWHPLDEPSTAIILQWRNLLEQHQIQQPFKQAHREIYLLTNAERNTAVYSNRFASHIIKQHQFNALCGIRGWHNKLRLMVDDMYPPASITLPNWQIRAEFWVNPAGDNYGVDTNESGTYICLSTDQVRFYQIEAAENLAHAGGGQYTMYLPPGTDPYEPIPLENIPPLLLSEILRDVDLFVGVASVGNDPTWEDGGPEGRYVEYWHHYSFGELSTSAETRKAVLERLIPRLKIADRCHIDGRYLFVKGELRVYKIHLGSGNILMEPNNQYLCIVPGQRITKNHTNNLFLPFEGDRTMAIILSKAIMLVNDTTIDDPTILRQIK